MAARVPFGRYLLTYFPSHDHANLHWPTQRAVDARAVIVVGPGKRKIRVLPRARLEPSGSLQEGVMNRRAIFTSTALKLANLSVYFLSVAFFRFGVGPTACHGLDAPRSPPDTPPP